MLIWPTFQLLWSLRDGLPWASSLTPLCARTSDPDLLLWEWKWVRFYITSLIAFLYTSCIIAVLSCSLSHPPYPSPFDGWFFLKKIGIDNIFRYRYPYTDFMVLHLFLSLPLFFMSVLVGMKGWKVCVGAESPFRSDPLLCLAWLPVCCLATCRIYGNKANKPSYFHHLKPSQTASVSTAIKSAHGIQ